ncbi:MAG: GNAT family N-acetyltransferase [Acidiferrobacteraceae bacterium]|nr:GNAT family N-acetyltransferase [Acidiferrobacteraceae bacterium]
MGVEIRIVDWVRYSEALSSLRHTVFVEEQGVPVELELDGEDTSAWHAAAFSDDGRLIGTGRMLGSGKIGRMAVSQSMRRQGIGRALLDALVAEAKRLKLEEVSLGAQLPAVAFYERAGFEAYGDIFLDAGIDHKMMRLVLG